MREFHKHKNKSVEFLSLNFPYVQNNDDTSVCLNQVALKKITLNGWRLPHERNIALDQWLAAAICRSVD